MKFDLREVKTAIAQIEKYGTMTEVDVEFDSMHRLIIKYSEPMGGDRCQITLYPAESEKMAEITTTTLLRS